MAVEKRFESDVEAILAHRGVNGAEYWATPDRNLIKGAAITTLECAQYLLELGMELSHPVLTATAALVLETRQEDGHQEQDSPLHRQPESTACA